jgi:glucose dehydrogenase
MKRHSAHSTFDLLLRENKFLSITLYAVAVLSILFGIVMLGFGMWRNQSILALAGAVTMYLFVPVWRFVQALRRENRLMRLFEMRRKRARTASAAIETPHNPFKDDTQDTAGDDAS